MRGERILGNLKQASQVASGEAVGLVPDQRAERFQTGGLSQCGEGEDGIFVFHISRFME